MVVEARVETSITRHAWNKDCTLLAVVPNDNTVIIFEKPAQPTDTWKRAAVLREHDALVTDIAWAPESNRIVTTSQDRNAYVWTYEGTKLNSETKQEEQQWKPMLVILRITAAATSVQWSFDEKKFAVGSGAKTVPVCYFEEGNNFWVSKMIKDHQSTILSIAWHPTSPIVATACTDYKVRLVSAYLKNLDGKGVETPLGPAAKFGTVLFQWESYGWVHDVVFSPDGGTLAMCAHNSTVSIINIGAAATGAEAVQTLRLSELPLTQLLFLPDGTLVGAGHCFNPMLFVESGGAWKCAGQVSSAKKAAAVATSARNMFQAMDKIGQQESAGAGAALNSVHQFCVCDLRLFRGAMGGTAAEFTSSARDGKVVWWTRDELQAAMQQLSIG